MSCSQDIGQKKATLLEPHGAGVDFDCHGSYKTTHNTVATRITVCFMGTQHILVVSSQLFHSTFTAVIEELLQVFLLH